MSETKTLKWGYTTGTSATAACVAALESLLSQQKVLSSSVTLPDGEIVHFQTVQSYFSETSAIASVIKDGGDDPDATHGLEIVAELSLSDIQGISFLHGEGVGKVTLPGLEIPVGEPAINPVPRKMIADHLCDILDRCSVNKGVNVTISVPNGREVASKTFNPRLGIVGGISILGTTGRVKPYSSEAYIASIEKSVSVCQANKQWSVVINSGGRSEKYLKDVFPHIPDFAFVQYGNWIGATLEAVNKTDIKEVTIGIMLGKAVKLAEGNLDTHSRENVFSPIFMAEIAQQTGYDSTIIRQILDLKLARNITHFIPFVPTQPFYIHLKQLCVQVCMKQLMTAEIRVLLVGQEGEIV